MLDANGRPLLTTSPADGTPGISTDQAVRNLRRLIPSEATTAHRDGANEEGGTKG